MIVGVYVAQFHVVVACLCYACLDGEEHIGLLLSRLFVVAYELEQGLDVFLVGVAHLNGLLVVVQIVVALAQTYSALRYSYDVLRRIALVGSHAYAEHHCAHALIVELSHDELILFLVLYRLNFRKHRFQRCGSLTVQTDAVHHQVVEVAYLLSE